MAYQPLLLQGKPVTNFVVVVSFGEEAGPLNHNRAEREGPDFSRP